MPRPEIMHPTPIDHVLALVIALIYPLYWKITWHRRGRAQLGEDTAVRIGVYREVMRTEWFLAALVAACGGNDGAPVTSRRVVWTKRACSCSVPVWRLLRSECRRMEYTSNCGERGDRTTDPSGGTLRRRRWMCRKLHSRLYVLRGDD